MFDWKEDGTGYSYLFKTITEKNKEELQMVMFPNLKISFEELFYIDQQRNSFGCSDKEKHYRSRIDNDQEREHKYEMDEIQPENHDRSR